jgi:hypothetical protein
MSTPSRVWLHRFGFALLGVGMFSKYVTEEEKKKQAEDPAKKIQYNIARAGCITAAGLFLPRWALIIGATLNVSFLATLYVKKYGPKKQKSKHEAREWIDLATNVCVLVAAPWIQAKILGEEY